MPPRLDAKRFFLTYAQVGDTDPEDLLAHLASVHSPLWIELSLEHHQDGNAHIHAVIAYAQRFRGYMDCFDFAGYHPNIQVVRQGKKDLHRVRRYIRKGDDGAGDAVPLVHGEVPVYGDAEETGGLSWGDILDVSQDSEEFKRLVRLHKPADFVLRNDAIEHFASHYYNAPQVYTPQFPADSFVVPDAVDQWMAEVFGQVSDDEVIMFDFELGSKASSPIPPFLCDY